MKKVTLKREKEKNADIISSWIFYNSEKRRKRGKALCKKKKRKKKEKDFLTKNERFSLQNVSISLKTRLSIGESDCLAGKKFHEKLYKR